MSLNDAIKEMNEAQDAWKEAGRADMACLCERVMWAFEHLAANPPALTAEALVKALRAKAKYYQDNNYFHESGTLDCICDALRPLCAKPDKPETKCAPSDTVPHAKPPLHQMLQDGIPVNPPPEPTPQPDVEAGDEVEHREPGPRAWGRRTVRFRDNDLLHLVGGGFWAVQNARVTRKAPDGLGDVFVHKEHPEWGYGIWTKDGIGGNATMFAGTHGGVEWEWESNRPKLLRVLKTPTKEG